MYCLLLSLLSLATSRQSFLRSDTASSIKTIPLRRMQTSSQERKSKVSFLQQHAAFIEEGDENFVQTTTEMQTSLILTNYANTEFVGSVGIGNPPQYLDVILDTGSANFWVNSLLCHDRTCREQTSYDHSLSADFEELGLSLEVQFGSGSVTGVINRDTVYISGVKVKEQNIGEIVDEYGSVFKDAKFAGILGLAYPSMAAYNFDPLMDNIIDKGILDNNMFSFYYSLSPNEQCLMTLGGVIEDLFTGEILWAPVITGHEYYWLIKLDDVRLGSKSLDVCSKGCKAAVDTGTSMLTAPTSSYRKLNEKLKLNCKDLSKVPDLVFVIGGRDFPIPAREYILTYSEEGEDDPGIHSSHVQGCSNSLMAMDIAAPHGPLWVLGDIFLTRYYSIFDRDNDRVGLANAVHSYD